MKIEFENKSGGNASFLINGSTIYLNPNDIFVIEFPDTLSIKAKMDISSIAKKVCPIKDIVEFIKAYHNINTILYMYFSPTQLNYYVIPSNKEEVKVTEEVAPKKRGRKSK